MSVDADWSLSQLRRNNPLSLTTVRCHKFIREHQPINTQQGPLSHRSREKERVKEEYCHWGLCSRMPDIPTSSTVGWLPGRYYATGRCLWDRVKVKEFILWGPTARDCGIGGGPADWGQHQGGVHSGEKLCPMPDTQLSSLVHYSHNLEMYLQFQCKTCISL